MKMVSAIIKHFKLDEVRAALTEAGVHGMTLTEVKGFGKQKGHVELYRGAKYEVNFLPKIKIEVAVEDEKAPEIIRLMADSARTGEIGDGKIFVYELSEVVRIRTGETGEEAI